MEIAKKFIINYPRYITLMKECTYHFSDSNRNLHHLEGDVWSHSKNCYIKAVENNYSDSIKWASLLHDIGRIKTRSINKEKTDVSFGDFEGVSIYLALDILKQTNLQDKQKSRILKIISYQYTIIDYIKYQKISKEEFVNIFKHENELINDLAHYVKCDLFARKVDSSKLKYYNDARVNEFIKYVNSLKQNALPTKQKKRVLNILVGPPCSRKSTFVRKHRSQNNIIINRDSCVEEIGSKYNKHTYDDAYYFMKANKSVKEEVDRIDEMRESMAKSSLDKDITIDNPNLSIKSRKEWIDAFGETHTVKVTLFLSSFEELLKCSEQREKKEGKSLTEKEFIKKLKTFVFPILSEGIDVIDYVYE